MTNLIQQQEALKDLSDQQIANEMQQPSGQMPLFLVSTEAKRRADLRQRFQAEQAEPPKSTVQEDLLRSIMNQQAPQNGIMSLGQPQGQQGPAQGQQQQPQQPQMQPSQQQQQMASPQQGIVSNGGLQRLPGNTQRGFAGGGSVRGFQAGGLSELAARQKEKARLTELASTSSSSPKSSLGIARTGSNLAPTTYFDPARARIEREMARQRALAAGQGRTAVANAVSAPVGTAVVPTNVGAHMPDYAPMPQRADLSVNPYFVSGNDPYVDKALFGKDINSGIASINIPPPLSPAETAYGDARQAWANYQEGQPAGTAPITPNLVGAYVPGSLPEQTLLTNAVKQQEAIDTQLAKLRGAPDPYAKREVRLDKRADRLERDRDRNPWLSLAKAGFAMAAGKSSDAFTNIAAGAGVGMDDLTMRMTDTNRRGERLGDARDSLDDARMARDRHMQATAQAYAQGLISAEARDNENTKAENAFKMAGYKVQEAGREAAHAAQVQNSQQVMAAQIANAGISQRARALTERNMQSNLDRASKSVDRERERRSRQDIAGAGIDSSERIATQATENRLTIANISAEAALGKARTVAEQREQGRIDKIFAEVRKDTSLSSDGKGWAAFEADFRMALGDRSPTEKNRIIAGYKRNLAPGGGGGRQAPQKNERGHFVMPSR